MKKEENKEEVSENKRVLSKKEKIIREIVSYALIIAMAFIIATLWKNFVATKIEVISGSMKDTLQIDDRLLVSKIPYYFGEPKRGDIVVFHFPDDESQVYIKRLIGLPGETVTMVEGIVYIDGKELKEDYVRGERMGDYGPYEVPEGEYFMMGDNRLHSGDAREWEDKYVSMKQIIGKAIFRYKPKWEKMY